MTLVKLILTLCIIESGNDPSAIGDNGKAIGILQMHEIMVREVNRIARTKYVYEDRLNECKSKAMAMLFFSHRVKHANSLTEAEMEDCVKAWNGGVAWKRGNAKKQENLDRYYKKFLGAL